MSKMNMIKVSDFIADILAQNNINTIFSVVGGSAMHLNHSFAHHHELKVIYNHHEQASAICAESFYKVNQKIAAICVTSGPGGTNAITGVLCAYMDSIPMVIISGQVRYSLSITAVNPNLRFNGEQEHQIVETVKNLTKYSVQIDNLKSIKAIISKAIYVAMEGRPGPVWIDVPLDIQAQLINPLDQEPFEPLKFTGGFEITQFNVLIDKLIKSKRPLIHVGSSVRYSHAIKELLDLANRLDIPITTGMGATDIIPNESKLFAGRPGITGDRVGNFAMQTCDLLISIGSRLSYKITGYNTELWAKESYKVMVDIDAAELERDYLKIDMKFNMDAKLFLTALSDVVDQRKLQLRNDHWLEIIYDWKHRYLTLDKKLVTFGTDQTNIYYFFEKLSNYLAPGSLIVTTSGTSRVIARQSLVIKANTRLITNHNTSPMGYDLPASIGVSFASGKKPVVLIAGDGGINMNIQELQTIKHHNLPIKIFIINNNGYQSIRTTQKSFFPESIHYGIGGEDADLSFPEFRKIAESYDIPYMEILSPDDLFKIVSVLNFEGPIICQVFVDDKQVIEPKGASRLSANGKMTSLPLENMYPFLEADEIKSIMSIIDKKGESND